MRGGRGIVLDTGCFSLIKRMPSPCFRIHSFN